MPASFRFHAARRQNLLNFLLTTPRARYGPRCTDTAGPALASQEPGLTHIVPQGSIDWMLKQHVLGKQMNLLFEGWVGEKVDRSLGRSVTVFVPVNFKERKMLCSEASAFLWGNIVSFIVYTTIGVYNQK